ncbi:MAG: DUF3987 domain-containing protein [Desulfarculaceae bacterium]|nr:DUF3987 domain-containing protein [Desulfarculaceae bacterium]MCF8123195.1 DUF3987 domain-containing protein [Desulfarculaceae bacterium]
MKTHCELGFQALVKAEEVFDLEDRPSFLSHAKDIAYTHHEKWNGTGYPQSLAGENIPVSGRLMAVADDVTAEALAALMAVNGERMAVISAEGGVFDTLGGRYQNGVPNLDLILKAHPGEPVRVDRKSGPPVMMQAPVLTICISPQPEVLANLPSKPGFRGRGLLARLVYVLPESLLGRRKPQGQAVPEHVSRAYAAALHKLLDLDTGTEGEPLEHCLRLEPSAHAAWCEFSKAIEAELVDGGRFETVRDWAGKLPGLAARLAGLLHVMEHLAEAPAHTISGQTMEAAMDLAGALVGHTLAAFGLMGADSDQEAAKDVFGDGVEVEWRPEHAPGYAEQSKRRLNLVRCQDCEHFGRGRGDWDNALGHCNGQPWDGNQGQWPKAEHTCGNYVLLR